MAEELNPVEQAEVAGEQSADQLAPPANESFKWYIIHAYSGFDRKVRESLESRISAFGLQNKIGRIMIPTEPVTELRNGKKYTIERVFLPGYVLIEMDLDNDLWHVEGLSPGPHTLRIVLTGAADARSTGTRVSISRSVTYEKKP